MLILQYKSGYTIRDTFTDTAGTSLSAHTADTGQSWTLESGTAEITAGGECNITSQGTTATIDVGSTDYEAIFEHTIVGDMKIEPQLRYQDNSNRIYLIIRDLNTAGKEDIRIRKVVGGVTTDIQTDPWTKTIGTTTWKFRCEGDNIKVWEGATLRFDVNITENQGVNNTKFGLRTGPDGANPPDLNDTYDNLTIRKI